MRVPNAAEATFDTVADPKRVYHNWTFGKRGYDIYVNSLLEPVRGNQEGVIKVLKALRKQLASGKAGWLPKNIKPTERTAGSDDTDTVEK